MAAPSTAYLFNGTAVFPIHIDGEIKLDSYPALKLAEYGNNILTLFYLDALLILDDEQGNVAFLGMVKEGSTNLTMHATARWFKQRLAPDDTNIPHVVMNDAGLNTLGISNMPTVLSGKVGDIRLNPTLFRSAYYVSTIEHGFEYYQENAWAAWGGFGTMNPAATDSQPLSAISIPGFKAGDIIPIRSYIVNIEGRYNSPSNTLLLEAAPLTLKFNGQWPSQANSGSNTQNIWVDFLPLVLGTYIYKLEQMDDVPQVSPGYYIMNGYWYEVRQQSGTLKMEVVRSGQAVFGQWPAGDPGNSYGDPVLRTGYAFASSGQVDQYINTCTTNHGYNRTLYLNTDNNIWYSDWSNTTNIFANPYTGYLMESASCETGYYSNGIFQYYL